MKVFVTGATGFIGEAVAAALARAGHAVVGLTRSAEKGRALEALEVEALVGNLDDATLLAAAVQRCEVVVHCAAEYSARYMELDRTAVRTLLDAAKAVGRPRAFVYTSGTWVHGDTGGRRVDESDELRPIAYVAPRAETERLVLGAAGGTLRTLVLRPGCVYGGSGSLTAAWFASAAKSGAAEIVGEGAQRWAMVHRDDLADAYVRAVESHASGEVFNVIDRSRFTVAECASAAGRALGKDGSLRRVPLSAALERLGPWAECLTFDQHVDASKALRRLGWNPRHGGFVDSIDACARAWRASSRAS
jgi:nucleoside-diphosphate-sugar epimerase